jgi:exonuclease VII small subunit
MWNDVQKKYESALNELEKIANRLQKLNLQFAELLAEREDIESF